MSPSLLLFFTTTLTYYSGAVSSVVADCDDAVVAVVLHVDVTDRPQKSFCTAAEL